MQLSSYIVAVLAKCIAMYIIFICYFNLGGSFGTHYQPVNEYCFTLSNAFPYNDRNMSIAAVAAWQYLYSYSNIKLYT